MKEYRYTLEKYNGPSTRYNCPSCGSIKAFCRYIDTTTGQHIDPTVGRCNREGKCGYHQTPKQFFALHPGQIKPATMPVKPVPELKPLIVIPNAVLEQSIPGPGNNQFYYYLIDQFGRNITSDLIKKYSIGTSDHWPGSTVFWFIDIARKIRAGQVKLFNRDGHTVKGRTTWIHSILRGHEKEHPWLGSYQQNSMKVSCLFGEHLLKTERDKPIAIVEAPATAIVASIYFPKFQWLATGSLSYLTRNRCRNLINRRVVIFPDLGCYVRWKKKAEDLLGIAKIKVSNFLERNASPADLDQGLDLRDYLTRFSLKEFKQINSNQAISKSLPQKSINPQIKKL